MKFRVRRATERHMAEIRSLDTCEFDGCEFPDGHTWWVVLNPPGSVIAYASAVYRPELGYVYLGRCMVVEAFRGHKLQRRLLKVRIAWAKEQNADRVITYTLLKNYESLVNLLRAGFRFYQPDNQYVGDDVHYYRLDL